MKDPESNFLVKKSKNIIQHLRSSGLDFNDLFVLECFNNPEDKQFFDMYEIPSIKDLSISTRYQTLIKNGFLIEDPNDCDKIILSVKGKDFLRKVKHETTVILSPGISASMVIIDLGKTDEEKFEEWWKTYPSTPAWKSDDGLKTFIGSRVLRNLRKADAKKRYLHLLNQGLKHEELVGSLLYEIKMKKVDSLKKNENQMEFFKGMESYFNQERYSLFIDNYKENPSYVNGQQNIKSKKQNVTDI